MSKKLYIWSFYQKLTFLNNFEFFKLMFLLLTANFFSKNIKFKILNFATVLIAVTQILSKFYLINFDFKEAEANVDEFLARLNISDRCNEW